VAVFDGRTGLEMISTPECWRLLGQHDVARLGVSVGGNPEIMPVNYAAGEGRIVFRTDAGTKYRALEGHPTVVLELDGFDAGAKTGWSVQVKGRAEVVHDPVTLRRLRAAPPAPWAPGEKSIWVRVAPTEVTGRRIAPTATGGTMQSTTEASVLSSRSFSGSCRGRRCLRLARGSSTRFCGGPASRSRD